MDFKAITLVEELGEENSGLNIKQETLETVFGDVTVDGDSAAAEAVGGPSSSAFSPYSSTLTSSACTPSAAPLPLNNLWRGTSDPALNDLALEFGNGVCNIECTIDPIPSPSSQQAPKSSSPLSFIPRNSSVLRSALDQPLRPRVRSSPQRLHVPNVHRELLQQRPAIQLQPLQPAAPSHVRQRLLVEDSSLPSFRTSFLPVSAISVVKPEVTNIPVASSVNMIRASQSSSFSVVEGGQSLPINVQFYDGKNLTFPVGSITYNVLTIFSFSNA